jgi:hypothetical protein
VVKVAIATDCRRFDPTIGLTAASYNGGEVVHFPFDRLLEFIIDHGCAESMRPVLKERLRLMRQKVSVTLFQRYQVNCNVFQLAIRCPQCGHGLLTQLRVFEGQSFPMKDMEPLECPKCRQNFQPREEDFFRILDLGPPLDG